jgi:hypothetical protein
MIERITMESRPDRNFSCLIHTRAFTRGAIGLRGATFLPAGFDLVVRAPATAIRKIRNKVKSGGQECPPCTNSVRISRAG